MSRTSPAELMRRRTALSLSRPQLADAMNVSARALKAWESETRRASGDVLTVWCDCLDDLEVDRLVREGRTRTLTSAERQMVVAAMGGDASAREIGLVIGQSTRTAQRRRSAAGVLLGRQQPTPQALATRAEVNRLADNGIKLTAIAARLGLTLRQVKHHRYGPGRPAQQHAA